MKTTPREGDYVSLGKEKSGNLIHFIDVNEHRIARPVGFITAFGDYPSAATVAVIANESLWFMVFCVDGKFHFARTPSKGRELSLSDLLGDDEPAWSGEGLPPVGAECEFSSVGHHDGFIWCKYHGYLVDGKGLIIEYHKSSKILTCVAGFDPKLTTFRPLKSEREIAIEEMENIRKEWKKNSCDPADLFGQLYAAGYRKIKDS